MKSLHQILPFIVQVLEDVKWHFRSEGDVVTLTRPSASPSPCRRSMQGTKSHHAGISYTWRNTGQEPISILLLSRAFLSLSLVPLVGSQMSLMLAAMGKPGLDSLFFKSILPVLHRCRWQAGDRIGFEPCFLGCSLMGLVRGKSGSARAGELREWVKGREARRVMFDDLCPASLRQRENLRRSLLQ